MLRPIEVISASLLAIAGCNPHQAQSSGGPPGPADNGSQTMTKQTPTPPPKPTSALAQVQQWAPAGSTVSPAGITVTDIELFAVRDNKPVPADGYSSGTLVGVVGGHGGHIVEGRDLVRAVIGSKPDPKTLAHIALWAARREGEILEAPQNDEQRKAKVGPPAVAGGALVFWVWSSGVGRMLQLAKLDLSTAAFELGSPPVSADDAVDGAIAALAGNNPSMQASAIRTLGASCTSAKARRALLEALASHGNEEVRRQVALAVQGCGADAVDPLIHALERDRSTDVQAQAAKTLGEIGDKRARPALEKAARSPDHGVALLAKDALTKLK
jgi:hypothetical protein